MKVPCRWLADYVAIDIGQEAIHRLAQRLTLAGLEVEGITRIGKLTGAAIGKIITCDPVSDSDHLHQCRVDVGDEALDIVCGAPNVAMGMVVPVVRPGGTLPGGMTIDRRTIRGQLSHGMICSKAELGLEDRSDGIWALPEALGLLPGTGLDDLLEHDDYVLDIKVPSNRPDCASVYGIAREVSALLRVPLLPLETTVDEGLPPAAEKVQIEIERPEDTPRYSAKLFDGVRIAPSPLQIQHRLIKAGMRPLSNVVDATNYVMLELGHPLHPFDAAQLEAPIVIRRARPGETFETLDSVTRELNADVLLIADQAGPLALAGVMGGERAEIRESTSAVLLEIASFFGHRIRQSARAVNLRSEASQRFERGLNPASIPFVAQRAAHLIQKLTGCRVHQGMTDTYPAPSTSRAILMRPARAAALLGVDVDAATCVDLLTRLQLPVVEEGDALRVDVPPHRADLEREVDLIEDVGRVYGYDQLISRSPRPVLRVGRKDRVERVKDTVRNTLVGLGMVEAITDGFDHRAWRELLGGAEDDLIRIDNPMTQAQTALRNSLLPDLLHVVETNLRQGVDGGMLFEWSRTFSRSEGEVETLAGVLFGRTGRPLRGKELVSLPLAKGVLDVLFERLTLRDVRIHPEDTPRFLHPLRSAWVVYNESPFGVLGVLDPSLGDAFTLPVPIILFELSGTVIASHALDEHRYQKLSGFPVSKRDLSVSAPRSLPEARIRAVLREQPTVQSVLLYDLYQGDPVPPDRTSLTYELSFRAADHTLTDEEVAMSMQRIENRLASLDVRIRVG